MEKFRNKYRISSTRLKNWDYGWNGLYFVTICTQNRECYFGNIADEEMKLSDIGDMANKYWHEIPQHFPFVKLHSFIVMPNHVHGIIEIDKIDDGRNTVETQNFASLQNQTILKNQFGPQTKNLASIIRGFKIGVTKNARQMNPEFSWQPRYHDHIIRSEKSYQTISEYILNNPSKWNEDNFNPDKKGEE